MYQAPDTLQQQLKTYYGKILNGSRDLKTNACCCSDEGLSLEMKTVLKEIDGEILERFYGCGSPLPPFLEGCTILDLGCGTGRDVYVASKLAGENGFVIGVDMTDEQLTVARRHMDSITRKFGYRQPNVDFRQGYVEDLNALDIKDESIDVVISNCVLNLSPDKHSVFKEIFRVLKPGGELYFSDVFAGRRVPKHLHEDPILHGECLAGAMYVEDFRRLLHSLGCPDYRLTAKSPISLDNPEVEEKIGMVDFFSLTVRAFKLDMLEDICEDYGQVAVYQGTIPNCPHSFELDDHHRFFTGKPMLVCGNTAAMLQETRFAEHFLVAGDRSTHYGPFACSSPSVQTEKGEEGSCSSGACC
jgi:SAM-dependent methyltransferase